MAISRKRFLEGFAGSSALLLWGCGGGGYGGDSTPPPTSSCTPSIGANHGHALSVAVADLDSPTAKTYDIKGNATHTHSVTFSPAQLQQLESGVAVTVTSTADATDGHSHVVSVSCFIY